MQFNYLAVAAMAALVSAENQVTFVSMDATARTIVWTGHSAIADTAVAGGANVTVAVPHGYIGNAYAVSAGAPRQPGMLAEFAFDSWGGATYFDVSAIVDADDTAGVYQMFPADGEQQPVSGCATFACPNAYYLWDDVQTKVTGSSHIVVTLGAGPKPVAAAAAAAAARRGLVENHPREAITDPSYRPARAARFRSALRWSRRS